MSEFALDVHPLGDFELEQGGVLLDARLVFQTFGRLAPTRDNVVVFPTYYTGTHVDNAKIVGSGRALDPSRWFIVIPNMFGNGVSTSPSNAAAGQRGADFPTVSVLDNVRAQSRLLGERFDVERLRLVLGWSMGGIQSYQWAAAAPTRVGAMLCICGAARVSPHNVVFLEGLRAALEADPSLATGAVPERGLKAFARVYAGWAYSQAFYRDGLFRQLGFDTVEALLVEWERDHLRWNPFDLLAMLDTWLTADIGRTPGQAGFEAALAAIEARAVVMPCSTDLYFQTEDNRREVARMRRAELREIVSDWGHIAGGPGRNVAAGRAIDAAIRTLLDSAGGPVDA